MNTISQFNYYPQRYSMERNKSTNPAFTSKLQFMDGTYEYASKAIANLHQCPDFLSGCKLFLKEALPAYKNYGTKGLKALKAKCFDRKPDTKSLMAIVKDRFEYVTQNLSGTARVNPIKLGDKEHFTLSFLTKSGEEMLQIKNDKPDTFVPISPNKYVVDNCVINLLKRISDSLNTNALNDFDLKMYLLKSESNKL